MPAILTKLRTVCLPVAGFFLLIAGLGSFIEDGMPGDDIELVNLPGEWEVTLLTGSFTIKPLDTNPSWCEKGEVTVYPIVDIEETFIKLIEGIGETDFDPEDSGSNRDSTLMVPPNYYDIERINLFIFQFSFDNGYLSNSVLEARSVPFDYIEKIKGLWSFAVGYWGKKRSGSGILIEGRSVSGTKWGGRGEFIVSGSLSGDNRIQGTWEWTENTAGPFPKLECRTTSSGSGTWAAVRR
ncbi:hypothetical protein [Muriicola marianensis]|nr:hypothetical protein [Muriicola marianensis]